MKTSLFCNKIALDFNFFTSWKTHLFRDKPYLHNFYSATFVKFLGHSTMFRTLRNTYFTVHTNVIWTFNNVKWYVCACFWAIIGRILFHYHRREMADLGDNKNVYNHLLFVANMLRNNSWSTTTFMSIMNRIYFRKRFHLSPSRFTKAL